MNRRPFLALSVLCWSVGLASEWATANAQSLLTDIGPGTAYGLNNNGQVVLSNGIWSNGTVAAYPTGFTGTAINASGQVAGALSPPYIAPLYTDAAIYSDGTVTNIGGGCAGPTDLDNITRAGFLYGDGWLGN
jgi:hypothetical protein